MTGTRPLKVFLCHSTDDKPAVRKLYRFLLDQGIDAWFDEDDLLPGQDWNLEIAKALDSCDIILACLSKNSVSKEGYVQREIKIALDKALEKPEGTIFIIPARLEECELPYRLQSYQWVDLFRDGGREKLLKALQLRAERLGLNEIQKVEDKPKARATKRTARRKPEKAQTINVYVNGDIKDTNVVIGSDNVLKKTTPLGTRKS